MFHSRDTNVKATWSETDLVKALGLYYKKHNISKTDGAEYEHLEFLFAMKHRVFIYLYLFQSKSQKYFIFLHMLTITRGYFGT